MSHLPALSSCISQQPWRNANKITSPDSTAPRVADDDAERRRVTRSDATIYPDFSMVNLCDRYVSYPSLASKSPNSRETRYSSRCSPSSIGLS